MKTFVIALLALAFIPSMPAADLKIAVVDMRRAISEYIKGKELMDAAKAKADKFIKERNERLQKLNELGEAASKLQKKAQDSVLSAAERAKAGAQLEAKAKELRELQNEARKFEQDGTGDLRQEETEVRSKILGVLTENVNKIGKAGGYNLVLDQTGASLGGIPVALFVDGLPDLTDELIKTVNAGATPAKTEEVQKPAGK